jgi:hypothetical protein
MAQMMKKKTSFRLVLFLLLLLVLLGLLPPMKTM